MNSTTLHFIRRWLGPALPLVVATLGAVPASAATGDLVAVCFNADGTDDFAIIALANIPGGTRYFISDNAWSTASGTLIQEGGAPSPNRQIQFDVAAGGIPFGTVIKFNQSGTTVVLTDTALGTLTMVARFPVDPLPGSTKLSFSTAGDQLLIYQTAGNTVGGAVTMVSAFNASVVTGAALTVVNGWQVGTLPQAGQTAATSECNAPAGLVVYAGANAATATALGLGSFAVAGGLTGQDNYKYNGPYGLADKTAYLTAINTPANWVANDTTAYDLSTVGPGPGTPEINVQGNAANIADGSVTPLAADHTLFGSAPVTGGTLTRTFTIQNLGTANLTVPASGITFSGANAGEFSVSGITLPATIAQAGSTTFVVTFDPTAAGVRTATVSIANNDSNENPYDFALQGNGFTYTAPAGPPPGSKWTSAVQNSNAGTTRGVGGTSSGDIIAVSKINTGSAGDIRVTRHAATTGAASWTLDIDSGNSNDVNDMLVDPTNGDTYIAARASVGANLNWFVHKVNGNGILGWTYTFDGTAAGADDCFAIARTSDGNVVVVGMTTTASGSFARAAKINASTGAEMNSYTSPVNLSQFNGVATDGTGNTYATGFINDAVNANGLTVKLNSTLGLVWSQTFDGTAALSDSLAHVVVHPSSGDCVVGGTTRTSASNSDAIVIRYGSAAPGTEVWRRVIAGAVAGSDALNNLVVDANGDLYASGAIRNVTSTDRDAYVSKITGTTGASAWITTRLGSAADSSDRFQNVRVAGSAVYAVGNIDNASRDILASRFNAGTGIEEWTLTFNGSGNGADDVFSGKSVMTLLGTDAIAIGGETLDVSANTYGIVLNYAPVLPPTVSNVSKSVNEDAANVAFAAAEFTGSYSDPNSDALATVRITSLPSNGVLKNTLVTITTVPTDIAIGSIANLNYTPNANYNGADSFGWNGSDGTLFAVSGALVNITVNALNDKPTFTAADPAAVNEDAGLQTVVGWASGFTAGPANESTQTVLGYTVSVSNGGLFSALPTVANNGTLSYTPAANANGTSTFQVRVRDSGGTALGGIDTSDAQTFTVTVNAVNDKPNFTAANPPTVIQSAGAQSVVGWVTSFNPGPANESGQTVLAYTVGAVGNLGLFSAPPTVANNGTLSYTPAANANGTSTFQVTVRDSGGTANSGINTSDPQTFTITVLGLDFGDAPTSAQSGFATSYPTLLAGNGARHVIPSGGATLYLGAVAPDADANGQPSADAGAAASSGDDNVSGTDDEDGVSLPTNFERNIATTVAVTVTGTGGKLSAWIDWNRDGDWDDAGEKIANNQAMAAGTTILSVTPPNSTVGGTSFARFRLSADNGLTPTGQASDGEVEDYSVTLVANSAPVAVLNNYTVAEGGTLSATDADGTGTPGDATDNGVLVNDTDANGDALTAVLVTPPTLHVGVFTLNANGTFSYVHDGSETTSDSFTYKPNDGTTDGNTVTVSITVTALNDSPVANPDSLVRQTNSAAKIAVSQVLANDTDPELNTLTVTGVNSPTANGATVTLDGIWLIYEPPAGFNAADSFTYNISDGNGGTATGTVNVTVAANGNGQTKNIISITPSGADMIVRFAGIAGRSYRIETTANLTPTITWTAHPAGPQTAGANGIVQLTDVAPPSPRFYRAVEN